MMIRKTHHYSTGCIRLNIPFLWGSVLPLRPVSNSTSRLLFVRLNRPHIIVGFAFKVWASRDTDNLGAWITSTVLLFVAPPIYAAADYFIFARTLHYVPSYAPMNPSRVVTTFVAADALCEILNSTGIGQVVNYDNPLKVRIGSGLIKVSFVN